MFPECSLRILNKSFANIKDVRFTFFGSLLYTNVHVILVGPHCQDDRIVEFIVAQYMMGDLKSRPVIGFRVTPDLQITLCQMMLQYAYIIIGATFWEL
jgi:hypothetical protein